MLSWVLIALTLTACSRTKVIQPFVQSTSNERLWQVHLTRLSQLNDWRIQTRIGVITEKDSGNASLFWEQRQHDYSIRIVAPMGKTILNINGDADGVRMRGEDGEMVTATNAEELIWRSTGWFIPVTGLLSWTLGKPDQSMVNNYALDEVGRLKTLATAGWYIEYLSYQNSQGIDLPKKMHIENKQLKIKLVIRSWELL